MAKGKTSFIKVYTIIHYFKIIVLTMIGVSNSNKTSYRNGCQSRTHSYI